MTYLRMNHFLKLRTPPPAATSHVDAPVPPPAAVPRVVPVSKVKRRHVALAACAILAAGCGRNEVDAVAPNGQPSQVATNHASIPQAFARDPSVPDASTVFAEQDAADKAKAALALPPQVATPGKKMTKEEESKAMPMPGQVNNHSSPVPAKSGGK